ncbi:MAG: alanine racemase [Armatimonadetes bacterium]|nr:alanine racemase [Armatimonadota bacterium]
MLRPTCAEIDLSAIKDNIRAIRARVGLNVKIMPAVKANAYGHGALQTSIACLEAGADILCVACVEEGIELRESGVDAPMLILGPTMPEAAELAVRHGLAVTVFGLALARALSEAALKAGKKAVAHIKVDTGMGRIGIEPGETLALALSLADLPGLELQGISTHFPCSDEHDRSFTTAQIVAFGKLVREIRAAGIPVPIAHASNSGAILAYPEADFDAVRPGIMIYGCYPSSEVTRCIPIREALTLKTRIVFMKEVEVGTPLSYGRTYSTPRKSMIATLPIGYGDGYSRLLSNRGNAAVRGVHVPVVGRVCMDQILIDVTDVPGVTPGDEVTLYGGGYDYLSVSKVAEKIGTISYEVFCNISSRVPRVYLG